MQRNRWVWGVVVGLLGTIAAAEEKPKTEVATDTIKVPGTVVEFKMVKLPAGKVTLKDKDGKETEHAIKPIWIGQYEVQWQEYGIYWQRLDLTAEQVAKNFDGENRPSKPYGAVERGWGRDGSPAMGMFANEGKKYCAWLNKVTGKKYRLPTEAEWEYACRSGGPPLKPTAAELKEMAWYMDNSDSQTQPVGQKKPNAWGLYDMLGNVAEWVVTAAGKEAVAGGSWQDEAEDVHSARREEYSPSWQRDDSQFPKGKSWLSNGAFVGFRVVREIEANEK